MKRRLGKALAAVGAIVVTGAVVALVMLASAVRGGFSARDQPSSMEAALARGMRSWSIPGRAKKLHNPIKMSPGIFSDAHAHWADHCAICHGENGSGQTPIGKNLYPKAPDMRARGTQDLSDGEIYFIIQNGIRLTGMPAWGDGDDDSEESWKLVAFIRRLPSLTREEQQQIQRSDPSKRAEGDTAKKEDSSPETPASGDRTSPTIDPHPSEHGVHKH